MPLWLAPSSAGDAGPVEHHGDGQLVQRDVHHAAGRTPGSGTSSRSRPRGACRPSPARPPTSWRAARRCRRRRSGRGSACRTPLSPVGPRHRGGDGDDVVALLAQSDRARRRTPTSSPGRRPASRVPVGRVDRPRRVHLVGLVVLGRCVALALAGGDVHDHRARRSRGPCAAPPRPRARRGRRPGRRTSARGPRTSPAGTATSLMPRLDAVQARRSRARRPAARRGTALRPCSSTRS